MNIVKTLTPQERAEWERQVAEVEGEWPELEKRFDLADAAAAEESFSGELRRAIHGTLQQGISLPRLFREAQVDWPTLDPFLHGEGELSSAVIDRLVKVLGLHLQATPVTNSSPPATASPV